MTADQLPMEILGETEIVVHFDGKKVTTNAVVSPNCRGVILSWQVSEALGIVTYHRDVRDASESATTVHKMTTPCPPKDKMPVIVIVAKKNGDCRVCVDLTGLNKQVRRSHYPVRTPKDAVSNVPAGMKYFTTLDTASGYWQIPLDEDSQDLTTFITPWGRYKYLRSPMGFSATGADCGRNAVAPKL